MDKSNRYDVPSLFIDNMLFLKKKFFQNLDEMSNKFGIRKSTLNDKLTRKSSFTIDEVQQIGVSIGIHPGLLLYFNLSEHMADLSKIESLLDLMMIPVIQLQIMSKFEEVKRLFKDDIINFDLERKENEKGEINIKRVG